LGELTIIAAISTTLFSSASAFAGILNPRVTDIPTLSEWGMIAMVGALGVIGAIVLRKRLADKAG
jgi:IPTL-CTERM motif